MEELSKFFKKFCLFFSEFLPNFAVFPNKSRNKVCGHWLSGTLA